MRLVFTVVALGPASYVNTTVSPRPMSVLFAVNEFTTAGSATCTTSVGLNDCPTGPTARRLTRSSFVAVTVIEPDAGPGFVRSRVIAVHAGGVVVVLAVKAEQLPLV